MASFTEFPFYSFLVAWLRDEAKQPALELPLVLDRSSGEPACLLCPSGVVSRRRVTVTTLYIVASSSLLGLCVCHWLKSFWMSSSQVSTSIWEVE